MMREARTRKGSPTMSAQVPQAAIRADATVAKINVFIVLFLRNES